MKSEFTFTDSFESFFGGVKVWITPYKEEETPDLPILDLGMDISISCRIAACLSKNEDKPEHWKSAPVMIYGKITARRIVIDSRGQSHMIYTVDPTHGGCDNVRHCIDNMLG